MQGWAGSIQDALQYIEENLTEELDMEEIAEKVYVSSFHFQRIFSALCGLTVMEYVRMRRLTLAGEELSRSDAKVIDIALKYGYDSPDSFTRAFTRFHGISPKTAKERGAELKSFAPLRIKLTLEGGKMMEYKIVEKGTFSVVGRKYDEIDPWYTSANIWDKYYDSGDCEHIDGEFGIWMNGLGEQSVYMTADTYNPCKDIPEGFVTEVFPAGTWAVFPCRGAKPSLKMIETTIWKEWLPNCREYKLAGDYHVEAYIEGAPFHDDFYGEIWIPVKRV